MLAKLEEVLTLEEVAHFRAGVAAKHSRYLITLPVSDFRGNHFEGIENTAGKLRTRAKHVCNTDSLRFS